MSKLTATLADDVLNVNPRIDTLDASNITGDGVSVDITSIEERTSQRKVQYLIVNALGNAKEISFFSNLLQASVISRDNAGKLLETTTKVPNSKDCNVYTYEDIEEMAPQRLHEKVVSESPEEKKKVLSFEKLSTFTIIGTTVYYRQDEEGNNLESHPAIPLRHYKGYSKCLAAAKAVDKDKTFITYEELSLYTGGVPELVKPANALNPDMWSVNYIITESV